MCFLFNQAPIEVTTSTREKKKAQATETKKGVGITIEKTEHNQ